MVVGDVLLDQRPAILLVVEENILPYFELILWQVLKEFFESLTPTNLLEKTLAYKSLDECGHYF